MKHSLGLGVYAGIPVKVHWTFGFIVIYMGAIGMMYSYNAVEILCFGLYMLCLYFCVVLHEYGHALMARKYGIRTEDIIITPIGGLARLESLPVQPRRELMVAIAGPMVNLLIAILLSLVLYAFGIRQIWPDVDDIEILTNPIGFVLMIIIMNAILLLFNLIPAFPMDGGRVLRALLSYKFPRLKATYIASIIGRIFAVGFVVFGAYNNMFILMFVGIFIYSSASREYKMMRSFENNHNDLTRINKEDY